MELEHLGSLPYLTNVLKETLRLYPLGVAFSRVATQDTELDGYAIPRGTPVLVSPYALGR